MDDGFDLDMNAVMDYVVLKAQYPTPECDCFDGKTIMIFEGDELNAEEKAKLERDIIAAGGTITNNIGIFKFRFFTVTLKLCLLLHHIR